MFEKLLLVFFFVVLCSLKWFFMANSAVYLNVNIALSKNWFNGVAYFENVRFRLGKRFFCWIFIFPSKVPDELNSLKEPSTFKG